MDLLIRIQIHTKMSWIRNIATYNSLSLDLFVQNEREVTREAGERLARDLNAVFLETCAKDNLCVNDLFQVPVQYQCCGSGSSWIRNFWPDPDRDPEKIV
jgi:hypothetical protein